MIYNKDWLEGSEDLDEESVDLIITDPPFGTELKNNKFFDDSIEYVESNIDNWIIEITRVLKEGSHCYFYIPTLEIDLWVHTIRKYLNFKNVLNTSTFTKNLYLKDNFCYDSQYIIYCSKGKAKRLNQVDWIESSSSWKNDKRNKSPKEFTYQYTSRIPKTYRANVKPNKQVKLIHPCQKNELLISKFILISSQEEDVVLDPFCGSGVVCWTAKIMNRNPIGFEIDKDYYEMAVKLLKTNERLVGIEELQNKKMF